MKLNINGVDKEFDDAYKDGLLLWAIRDGLEMIGTRYGCGAGICGSCTVHVDGVATRSCITPVQAVANSKIRTLEGLVQPDGTLHPVQQAFLDEQVPQCAWCMSGQMMTAVAFLETNSAPTPEQIIEAMKSNYCRCGCYHRIKSAVGHAAENMQTAVLPAVLPEGETA
ncbi:MAG: isoquinoline 1-oxidoreductase alpha subunit [Cellvibrionaceae bacterium]|jgi:isoquinoline 1-oxidoreductase alpha subunit